MTEILLPCFVVIEMKFSVTFIGLRSTYTHNGMANALACTTQLENFGYLTVSQILWVAEILLITHCIFFIYQKAAYEFQLRATASFAVTMVLVLRSFASSDKF